MDNVKILPGKRLGYDFIPEQYLPKDKDEYYLRNSQFTSKKESWRHLTPYEVGKLKENYNISDKWNDIYVTDEFDPELIRNTCFYGLIRIGRIRNAVVEFEGLKLSTGISNSVIISCDIGDDVAIHNVRHLAHYIIGDQCILMNIDEMRTTNHAKFGNGIIKDGESEDSRTWLEIINEAGGRKILAFNGMIPADAYLWAKYRDDFKLLEKLKGMTQKSGDSRRGFYGTIGNQTVIKNTRHIEDIKTGECCYISGVNTLKNLTIHSTSEEPTRIEDGVELIDGIIATGCHIACNSVAVRFVMGCNTTLKYGARFFDSFLGDNSTITCCEVVNNLIYPAHEQHHNNSFLIASLVMGQSNIAAGATIGSNHNSRAADNELHAGRGFWPGLCASLKHPSRFASFVLLAKADYQAELDIPLPFSLVNNNISEDRLEIMPGFWWLYNMYALTRNTWKFQHRDKRRYKFQHIEFDYLAPDTVEEIFYARSLLEKWTAIAYLREQNTKINSASDEALIKTGQNLFGNPANDLSGLQVYGEGIEKSQRNVLILKAVKAYHAYGDMLHYYAIKNLLNYMTLNHKATFSSMCDTLKSNHIHKWINLGGQLIPATAIDQLRRDIRTGVLGTWNAVHERYNKLWAEYPLTKQAHSFTTLCKLIRTDHPTGDQWLDAIDKAIEIQDFICEQVYITRKKDFDNLFTKKLYADEPEMAGVVGDIDENSFVKLIREDTAHFKKIAENVKKRG